VDPVLRWVETDGRVTRAVTDRSGGVSSGRYAGLNLGAHVGDDPGAVTENRARLAVALGVPADALVVMEQVHGAEVAVVDAVPAAPPRADAVLTRTPGLALLALVADCTPVLLADPEAGVVGAVHAGRPGLAAGVVPAAVRAMRDLGAGQVDAVVGPSVCGRCYEVPEDLREEVAAGAPESRAVSWSGTPALDVAAGVVAQLAGLGVAVRWLPGCSRERLDLFSFRRDGTTGRCAGVVVLGPAA
jgi:YfiH family protein